MKIGLYDSGLGGLSVLKQLLADKRFADLEYIYYGDSANAPYGEKTPEELKKLVYKIFDFMQEQKVDLLISACNTSSAFLDQMDLSKYNFKLLNLFEVMKQYFKDKDSENTYAFMATAANIDSARYKEWQANIFPIKCRKLVPLIEAGEMEAARAEFSNYLAQIPSDIHQIILACTHYSFCMSDEMQPEYRGCQFIDPAKELLEHIEIEYQSPNPKLRFYSSGDIQLFKKRASLLLNDSFADYKYSIDFLEVATLLATKFAT